ncbi:MAG: hypothetical protein ABMB14_18095 [Myxococcota bacterium]
MAGHPVIVPVDDVIAILNRATLAEPGVITGATRLDALPNWDSIGAVYLVGEAMDRWGSALMAEDFAECATVAALAARIALRAGG